ncbi:hypothetical protein V500_00737 [Pseudogymnoascus sp. VKM F-4518 (FW-2643)]|nr:hypothetical protein V500_00737 [Pseudogymnoascus sp. VKM F-4518 (FW-2643)]
MSPQQQNNGNRGVNTSRNAPSSIAFSLATLAAGPLVPPHYPLIDWLTNVSRRDNPVTDFLFEFIPVEKSQKNAGSDATAPTLGRCWSGEATQCLLDRHRHEEWPGCGGSTFFVGEKAKECFDDGAAGGESERGSGTMEIAREEEGEGEEGEGEEDEDEEEEDEDGRFSSVPS